MNFFARRRETNNCTILTVSPPIYAIGEKKLEKKIQSFNRIRTREFLFIAQLVEHRTGIHNGGIQVST